MALHWVLVGLMGSGKTTIGTLLAERSGRAFVDNDAQLFAVTGRTAAEVQAEEGRAALHRVEREAIRTALEREVPAVIAAAASVVDDPATRELLKRNARVVWLDVAPDELAARVRRQSHRPLDTDPRPQLEEQLRVRQAALRDVAGLVVDAGRRPDDVVERILTSLA